MGMAPFRAAYAPGMLSFNARGQGRELAQDSREESSVGSRHAAWQAFAIGGKWQFDSRLSVLAEIRTHARCMYRAMERHHLFRMEGAWGTVRETAAVMVGYVRAQGETSPSEPVGVSEGGLNAL